MMVITVFMIMLGVMFLIAIASKDNLKSEYPPKEPEEQPATSTSLLAEQITSSKKQNDLDGYCMLTSSTIGTMQMEEYINLVKTLNQSKQRSKLKKKSTKFKIRSYKGYI